MDLSFLYENPITQNIISWYLVLFGIALPVLLIFWWIGLKGFVELTKYEKGESFLYRLNPITKILFGIVIMAVASTTVWWIGALLTFAILPLYLTLNNGLKKFGYVLMLTFSSLIGSTWAIAPYTPPYILNEVFPNQNPITLWVWPNYFTVMGYVPDLTLQAIYYGLQTAFRITVTLVSALLLVVSTSVSDLFKSFTQIKVPLAITFSLMVGFRTIPKIFELLDTSLKMQILRGLGYGKPRILRLFYYILGGVMAIVPTMVYLFRGAKSLAISADTRGFRAYPKRTLLKEPQITKYDYIMLGIIISLIILDIVANMMGFGRSIPYVGL
ncbi:energy-coupling factor transporter transmembrane component T family protein [Sulfurisphaera ohwakuensis]|uniref:Energy-coupling factor transport system permease protein n=1 Tax=Sulfurisphaera ohwakuensis TaxID=69656 RepID=A0A650CFT0_SULOH|nr:energy-coupling factor transporter transmembrane protein EcfT [Sulfurisphaera ohwakuensis]MBB5254452.1 energy-coupling factor transport system permease protein [Sulfurisphaera ohwakuensis]QGR16741.1 energy-coupling factor transporter transmembrane protein EcfT [Sulfurisphaera ohwakuensis]